MCLTEEGRTATKNWQKVFANIRFKKPVVHVSGGIELNEDAGVVFGFFCRKSLAGTMKDHHGRDTQNAIRKDTQDETCLPLVPP